VFTLRSKSTKWRRFRVTPAPLGRTDGSRWDEAWIRFCPREAFRPEAFCRSRSGRGEPCYLPGPHEACEAIDEEAAKGADRRRSDRPRSQPHPLHGVRASPRSGRVQHHPGHRPLGVLRARVEVCFVHRLRVRDEGAPRRARPHRPAGGHGRRLALTRRPSRVAANRHRTQVPPPQSSVHAQPVAGSHVQTEGRHPTLMSQV
jgi:hypothetical protein